MAEIVKIKELNSDTFEFQDYSTKDDNLIPSLDIATSFNPSTDYLEYFVLDLNNEIQFSNTSGFPNYTLLDNQISIDPEANLRSAGFSEGSYNTHYNFLSNKLGSNSFTNYYISEISTDRTELRIESTQLSDEEVISSTSDFIKELSSNQSAYPDFYLNFNNNQLVIANNIELDGNTVLIKLYEPLPSSFGLKSELWVVEKVAESKSYNISITQTFDASDDNITLQGPNLNIDVKDNINNSTEYKSFSDLTSTSTSQGSGSFLYQINNKLKSTGLSINIDYTDYSNFIHFSSAKTRLENFYYKLSLIEEYTVSSSYSDNSSSGSYYVSSSNNIWQSKINELIEGFDGYEYHLYFNSGSTSWPKTGVTPPYTNEPTDNPGTGYSWFVTQSLTAENYDLQNNNALINTVPEYLREDPNNANYELFVEMIGQQFDNIYLYLKDVTNKFNADNRLNYGVSKDLVADAIRDLGVKIYQNNFSADDVYTALIGIDPTGNLFGLPNTTGSLPSPAGYEHITTYVTASSTSSLYPIDDINKSIYKRIYHNLPYLLKKKGTIEGVRALITTFGIPDTILRVNEFGGKDKDLNTWDYWTNDYDYKFTPIHGTSYISSSFQLNPNWGSLNDVPSSIQFRFNAGEAVNALASQSLWSVDNGDLIKLVLEYDTTLPTTSGSYSGSVIDPEYQYAYLKFTVDAFATSASVRLPFYNNNWWSVQINRNTADTFEIFASDKIYSGNDGSQIGFIDSSSVTTLSPTNWDNGSVSWFSSENGGGIGSYLNFRGSYQEIRYFNQPISQSVFKDYVMNPQSIEGNGVNSSYDQLVFRLPLGGELYTGSTSIHPKITGSSITQSFASDSLAEITSGSFTSNKEYQYVDQLVSGIKNRNSHKIKTTNVILPTSSSQDNIPNADVLSAFKSVQQNTYVSESYTKDVDYVEVAFSPQNEINDDISNQLGYINIGEYIGDPRQISSSNTFYPDLNTLRDDYFKKYTHNYDVWDYVRLIKYFDNSLFKMIKDWVPSRTSLAAGVVIKQHLLERNKYPTPQFNTYTTTSFEGSGSFTSSSATQSIDLKYETVVHTTTSYPDSSSFFTGVAGTTTQGELAVLMDATTDLPLYGLLHTLDDNSEDVTSQIGTWTDMTFLITDLYLPGTFPQDVGIVSAVAAGVHWKLDFDNSGTTPTTDPSSNSTVRTLQTTPQYSSSVTTITKNPTAWNTPFTFQNLEVTGSPIQVGYVTGSNGGSMPELFGATSSAILASGSITQSWTGGNPSVYGAVPFTQSSQDEFFNGELSGSALLVEDGELNPSNSVKKPSTVILQYESSGSNDTNPSSGVFYWNFTTVSADLQLLGYGVDEIYINEIDNTGTNIETALSNLIPGNEVTFTVSYQYEDAFGVTGPVRTRTVTQTIENISGAGLSVWRISFTEDSIQNLTTPIYYMSYNQYVLSNVFFDPYINTPNFGYSDENALINNGTNNRSNTFYYDVDYSSDNVLPINKSAILAGNAVKATVPDSNFTTKAITNSRYTGKTLQASKFNTWTDNDLSYGKTVTVGNPQTYFAYFNWVGGTSPEWGNHIEDRTSANIRFYIDENGDVVDPINDSEGLNLGITRQNFEEDKNAIIALDSDDEFGVNLGSLNNEWPVFKSGYTIAPIIYTQTASYDANGDVVDFGYTGSITFSENDLFTGSVTVSDFQLTAYADVGQSFLGGDPTQDIVFSTALQLGNSASLSSNVYSPVNDSPSTQGVTLTVTATIAATSLKAVVATYAIQDSSGNTLATTQIDHSSTLNGSIIYTDANATTATTYKLVVLNSTGFDEVTLKGLDLSGGSTMLRVQQQPLPSTGDCTSFWTVVAGTNKIKASNSAGGLNQFYKSKQDNIPRSGFNPITLPFEVQIGDEIRFEGTETLAFRIEDVESTSGQLQLTLDRIVPTNTNTDFFLLRRYIDDPSYIILDVDKPSGPSSGGILKPQYLSSRVESNLDTILKDLQDKNLI